MDNIILKISTNKKYFSTVRLTISSIANTIGMDVESIEDLKVSISEILNMFVDLVDFVEISINVLEDKIEIEVKSDVNIENINKKEENKFSVLILESLVDKVSFEKNSIFIIKNKG